MGNKKVLWVKDQGGILLDFGGVEDSIYFGDNWVLIWDGIPGDKAPKIPEKITLDGEEWCDSIQDMAHSDVQEYLDALVGSESRLVRAFEPVGDSLIYDMNDYSFGSLADCETTKTYEYFRNGNRTVIYLDENDAEYNIEILDTYGLDYIDYSRNRTNYEYGGTGLHAKLHKVLVEDGTEKNLLWHEWSQWQGDELDTGKLITAERALERLKEVDHPEYDEIAEWLSK